MSRLLLTQARQVARIDTFAHRVNLAAHLVAGVGKRFARFPRSQQHWHRHCPAGDAHPVVRLRTIVGCGECAGGRRSGRPVAGGNGVGGRLPTLPVLRRSTPDLMPQAKKLMLTRKVDGIVRIRPDFARNLALGKAEVQILSTAPTPTVAVSFRVMPRERLPSGLRAVRPRAAPSPAGQ